MIDPDKFKHDRSAYERPSYGWRCGRGADWGKPCASGPNPDGSCGGTAECAPAKVGERYECRRPAIAGGPCADGPCPDGSCSQKRPPCRPRRSLRRVRGLVSLFALLTVTSLIALFLTLSPDSSAKLMPLDPGPLTDGHAKFTGELGCVACHAPHDRSPGGWFAAAFTDDDLTNRCLDCHTFAGPARLAHNAVFPDRPNLGEFACVACHTEHKGREAEIAGLSDGQCNGCHRQVIRSFPGNHPEFPAGYPYSRRNSIQFDHLSHISVHFTDPRYAGKAPQACTDCHAVEAAQAAVKPAGFAENCAGCHGEAMAGKPMVVLRLPEFEDYALDVAEVEDVCGPIEDLESIEDFEPISGDEMSPIGAYLLGVSSDEPEDYGEAMQEMVFAMAESGASPLAELIDARRDGAAAALLGGLNPELAKRTACAWASNLEYEAPEDAEFGGWYGDELELSYRPAGHADPVAKAWIDFALEAVARAEDDEDYDRALAIRWQLLDPRTGVGACVKCHAVSRTGEDADALEVEWTYRESAGSVHTVYSHGPHLNILSAEGAGIMESGTGCQTCHLIDKQARYREAFADSDPHHFESNFAPITKATCANCHAKGEVRQECQLCHVYHTKPGFKLTERLK